MREAVILAGGLGTRLREELPDTPKVLAPVAGKPFLAHVLGLLDQARFHRVVLATGYRAEDIQRTFGSSYGTMELHYSRENKPLGTGGAVWKAASYIQEEGFFILNGDTYAAADIDAMEKALTKHQADIVMATHAMKDTGRYGRVEINAEGLVTTFREKAPGHEGRINAGVYCMRRDLIQRFKFSEAFSLEKDLFQAHSSELRIVAVPLQGYFIDIGIPEDYRRANQELGR